MHQMSMPQVIDGDQGVIILGKSLASIGVYCEAAEAE
jgi:hypothetical protein